MFRKSLLATAAIIALLAGPPSRADELPTAEIVARFAQRPGNPAITPDGRRLVSIHPLDRPDTRIVEVGADGVARVYPNAEMSAGADARIGGVIAIRVADDGTAWILDLVGKRLLAWDTRAERLSRSIDIPASVLRPASFLQDFALDQRRGRIVIADMTQGDLASGPQPAFVVVDLASGAARRVAEGHAALMPETPGGFALNPITIDPSYDWVYFGALNGRTVYRVPAAAFDGDGAAVPAGIERYGPKAFSDGITVDAAGNVYVTDIERHAIGLTTPGGYRVIARLPEGQSWPDGFSFGPDGHVYVTVNQLDRSAALGGGADNGHRPFLLVRIPAVAPGTTGR